VHSIIATFSPISMDLECNYAQAALENIYEFELYLEFTTTDITTGISLL
jgi:hypothetical protein